MSVLNVVHGYSQKHQATTGGYLSKYDVSMPVLTISLLRKAEHIAASMGLQFFPGGFYRAWIHPLAMSDMLSDTSSDSIVDIFQGAVSNHPDRIRISNTEFISTTAVRSTFLFGSNSDLFKLEYIFHEGIS